MKFLIDRCAGRMLGAWLSSQGHDVLIAADLGPDPGDSQLLKIAADDHRILITIDNDFGTLVFREAFAHQGLIRLPDVPSPQRIHIMDELIKKHSADMLAKSVITVRGSRIRITPPPTP